EGVKVTKDGFFSDRNGMRNWELTCHNNENIQK
ncbi:MAG: hypothetical protein ACI81W_000973, partial [Saprospiraceae bacterium]